MKNTFCLQKNRHFHFFSDLSLTATKPWSVFPQWIMPYYVKQQDVWGLRSSTEGTTSEPRILLLTWTTIIIHRRKLEKHFLFMLNKCLVPGTAALYYLLAPRDERCSAVWHLPSCLPFCWCNSRATPTCHSALHVCLLQSVQTTAKSLSEPDIFGLFSSTLSWTK